MGSLAGTAQGFRKLLPILLLLWVPLSAWAGSGPGSKILLSFWCDHCPTQANDVLPGSLDDKGKPRRNPMLQEQLSALNVVAYAFLQVNKQGRVYFAHPRTDLGPSDVKGYCAHHPGSCPDASSARNGSFAAFSGLDNSRHTLKKIVSIGGAGHFTSFRNAVAHPKAFVDSVVALAGAYHLDGVDLDDEPPAFFDQRSGSGLLELVKALRAKLGPAAFISVDIPSDRETLRSIDNPTLQSWHDNLAEMAESAYLSVMGYGFHAPFHPGAATGNFANLYSDPNEPLLSNYYHSSDTQTIEYLTFLGVPPSKIILGFPATAFIYGGVEAKPGTHGLYQPFDKKDTPLGDLRRGIASYRSVQKYLDNGFTRHYVLVDGKDSAVYAFNRAKKQWITYEDPATIAAKAHYVIIKDLAGLMMWNLSLDAPEANSRSLLRSAHGALHSSK